MQCKIFDFGAIVVHTDAFASGSMSRNIVHAATNTFARAESGLALTLGPQTRELKKVLFIDDEVMLVTLGKAMLEALGYTPSAFSDPHEGIAAFRADPGGYAAAFTDLSMPATSGFEVARELLAIRGELPVFVMSGNVVRDDERRAAGLGVREVVLKPISMDQLREMLARVDGAS